MSKLINSSDEKKHNSTRAIELRNQITLNHNWYHFAEILLIILYESHCSQLDPNHKSDQKCVCKRVKEQILREFKKSGKYA
jgi:hypothetical protein